MVEVEIGGGEAGVPEQALHLLQRIAEKPPIALHRRGRIDCAFHPDIGGDLLQQAARHQHAPPAITLGQRRRQRQPGLVARRVGEKSGEFGGQQKRRLFEPQAGRHQQLGKQRITCAIAIAGTGALSASDGQTAKSDITENTILL